MPPHWATLKLALVHVTNPGNCTCLLKNESKLSTDDKVAVHTPVVFTVWYLPAYLLDRRAESYFQRKVFNAC